MILFLVEKQGKESVLQKRYELSVQLLFMYRDTCGCGENEQGMKLLIEKQLEGMFAWKSL